MTPASRSGESWNGLFQRYRSVTMAAWRSRGELAGPRRLTDEYAFLPGALSLQETPVHPAPRRLMWLIVALFCVALAWSILGEVDIVAIAPGQIVVSDHTKVIQPLDAGVIKEILVKDGDHVQAGQTLIQLDTTTTQADLRSLHEQYLSATSDKTRTALLMAAMSKGGRPVTTDLDRSTTDLLQTQWSDIQAKLAKLDADVAHREAEQVTAQQMLIKLETTLPLARRREADFLQLAEQGFMSSHAGQDRTRERIELERDLHTQEARLKEAVAALAESHQEKIAYQAETHRDLADKHEAAALKVLQIEEESNKAQQRKHLLDLTSPIDGVVQQLAVHSAGGVVTPAQQLLVVVPDESAVVAEVNLQNKDIGHIELNQAVEIKLDTFNFTRYGTVAASVTRISQDAVNDEKKGAMFPATLALLRKTVDVDGRQVRLTPGLTITAEIKTGRRRVIDFLLSPLHKRGAESLTER